MVEVFCERSHSLELNFSSNRAFCFRSPCAFRDCLLRLLQGDIQAFGEVGAHMLLEPQASQISQKPKETGRGRLIKGAVVLAAVASGVFAVMKKAQS
jgi:hypothetical protein